MSGLAARLGVFFDSMTARVMVFLTVGIATASILSLVVAEQARVHDFNRMRFEGLADSAVDIDSRLARDPAGTTALLQGKLIFGAREAPPEWRLTRPNADLKGILRERLGPQSQAQAMVMPRGACFPKYNLAIRAAGMGEQAMPDCALVVFRDTKGTARRLAVDIAPFRVPPNSTLDPLYLGLIVCTSALLSFLVARLITAPLRQLTKAARIFSVTIDPEPIPEQGPGEVRAALRTYNIMQDRVRDGFSERTQILASITHDLQTPLTRLRLRLEHVHDEPLRERLVTDLGVMQRLVRDGLDLARSSESREPWSVADIDSILSSVAEDAAEFGAEVHFVGGCGAQLRIKPNALVRCLNNLVDNAVKYAGDAELSCVQDGQDLVIYVRDHGPGLPADGIEEAMQPFRRPGAGRAMAVGGTGIGLTIARAQAQTFNGSLTLYTPSDGGLLAAVRIRRE